MCILLALNVTLNTNFVYSGSNEDHTGQISHRLFIYIMKIYIKLIFFYEHVELSISKLISQCQISPEAILLLKCLLNL